MMCGKETNEMFRAPFTSRPILNVQCGQLNTSFRPGHGSVGLIDQNDLTSDLIF